MSNLSAYIFFFAALGLAATQTACAYDAAFPATDSGKFEIKTLPAAKVLRTSAQGDYFAASNTLFRRLFRYIESHGVAMTTPVEARMQPASMAFYVGKGDLAKKLEPNDEVEVVTLPTRTVASHGVRGGYTKERFEAARKRLEDWLERQEKYEAAGPAYSVYWNSPFIPGFLKRSEVHIPVRLREAAAQGERSAEPQD